MKNILLVGAGRFGRHIAMQLSQLGHQIMAVDTNEERINDVLPYVTNAQIGDSTNAEFLRSLGIGNFDVCLVTIGGSFQNVWCRVPNVMCRRSFCFATAPTMWSTRKNRWQNGQQSAIQPIIFSIT